MEGDDSCHRRHGELKADVKQGRGARCKKKESGNPQRVQRIRRSLTQKTANEKGRHNDGPYDRRPRSRESHVQAEGNHRQGRARELDCPPTETKSHQKGTEQNVQYHPDQEDVEAGDSKEVHQARSGKPLALRI
jgi:hypothetical protein